MISDSPLRAYGRLFASLAETLRPRFVKAMVVNAPLVAFLLYYRLVSENRYVTYTLAILGDFPKGFLSDLTVVLFVMLAWTVLSQEKWAKRVALLVLVPSAAFLVLFRATDYYYYSATKAPLNVFVLYGNLSSANEGAAVVLSDPFCALLVAVVALHYAANAVSVRYSSHLSRFAERIASRRGRRILVPAVAATAVLLAINAHALRRHPRRTDALRALSGEYMFVSGLPRFFREDALTSYAPASKPERFYLPPADGARTSGARPQRRPNIFLITVESFNSLYTLPPSELHSSLTHEVMPFFKSLASDGQFFSNVYTSAAYTFNGIIAVLCSQYTMSESVWGKDCLPQLLGRNGYDTFSFVSIPQLRPYRYDNFRAMGFDRSRVFDAITMRRGKRNVYFNAMTDQELFTYAAAVADSLSRAGPRPFLVHISTDQMHVPGLIPHTGCSPYAFPASLKVEALTRRMLDAAHCTDQDLAELVAHLKRSGLYDDALVVITADHAFNLSFWDHTESELAKIPLFIKFPRADSTMWKLDTARLAAQVDIVPTIIDYLGIESERPMYGRSLLASAKAPPRSVPGISSSRLLSMANESGAVLHQHGKADVDDVIVRRQLDALYQTVLYFDQNPKSFEATVRTAGAPSIEHTP